MMWLFVLACCWNCSPAAKQWATSTLMVAGQSLTAALAEAAPCCYHVACDSTGLNSTILVFSKCLTMSHLMATVIFCMCRTTLMTGGIINLLMLSGETAAAVVHDLGHWMEIAAFVDALEPWTVAILLQASLWQYQNLQPGPIQFRVADSDHKSWRGSRKNNNMLHIYCCCCLCCYCCLSSSTLGTCTSQIPSSLVSQL